MSLGEAAALLAAGVGAGVIGTVAGLASLVSYPTLLAVGLGPVAANVTNTVALIGNSLGSVVGSRPELGGQRRRIGELSPMMLAGGAVGAVLILTTPADSFSKVVPFLIAGSALLLLCRPRIQAALNARQRRLAEERGTEGSAPDPDAPVGWRTRLACFVVGIYGGYFGAGAGVMMLALLSLATADRLIRVNALKNLLLGLANGVAAIAFAFFGPVDWAAVVPLVIGCFAGGYVGPAIARVIPPRLLRILIGLAGVYLAVKLGLDAY